MSNLNLINTSETETRFKFDEIEVKNFIKEIENFGYVLKVDDTVPLNHDKIKLFNRFRVRMDTKYKVYEVDVWVD